jgi:putative peptide zinc metalloprotease protein
LPNNLFRKKQLFSILGEKCGLELLEAGARPEELDAQHARLNRIQEELRYLEELQTKLLVYSPVGGFVSTPHFRELVDQFFNEGDAVLLVEDIAGLEAEVQLDEQAARRVTEEQSVVLRPRAVPLKRIAAHVRRVSVAADASETGSTVTVYCALDEPSPLLRPGMSGYARIHTGKRPVGAILLDRLLRHLRTDYWL